MARILVTGGAGYVGSHVMWALHDAGHHPVALDNMSRGNPDNIKGLDFIRSDYTSDPGVLKSALDLAEVVVHCAALTSAPESMEVPGLYYRHNVDGMRVLLDAMMFAGMDKIVFSSSAAVYDDQVVPPYNETDRLRPANPYGGTKFVGEQMLRDFDMNHIALRYFNVAGADGMRRCGPRLDTGSLFANMMRAALGDGKTTLYRANPDEFPIRDFIHPTDLGGAHVLAVNALLEGTGNATYNVGTGTGHSVIDVFTAFQQQFPHMTAEVMDPRPGDPPMSVAEGHLITAQLGWLPTGLSALDAMVATLIGWHRPPSDTGAGPQGRGAGFLDQFS